MSLKIPERLFKAVFRLMWPCFITTHYTVVRRVWRYQRCIQNPLIKEEQKAQWSNEKGQKDIQQSTKPTHKAKDRVTRTSLKTEDEFRCSGRVGSSCSTSDTRRVNLVTNPVTSHKWGKNREVLQLLFTVTTLLKEDYWYLSRYWKTVTLSF